MRGRSHEKRHAAHLSHHKRYKGGRIPADGMEAGEGGGNPHVEEEAEEKKKGGRAKHRKHGGHVDGHKGHHRMDHHRPGRKRGGRVGADTSPLSSAHNIGSPEKAPKEEEGGLSK